MHYLTWNLNPAILHLGPLEIRWYGLMYVFSFIISYNILKYFIKKGSLLVPLKELDNLMMYIFLGMLIGARIFYVIFYNFSEYLSNPIEIFYLWRGGLSFHGAAVGIIIATILFTKKHKISIFHLGDYLVLCGAIGIFLGRIGNFINGELWGRETTVPWGIIFPDGGPNPRHPSQLYQSFTEGLLLAIILFVILKKQKKTGTAFYSFFILYGIIRFFMEFFRQPDSQLGFIVFGLSMGQLLCIGMLFIPIIFSKFVPSQVTTLKSSNKLQKISTQKK